MKRAYGVMAQSVVGLCKAEKIRGSALLIASDIGVSKQRYNTWKTSTLIPKEYAERICIATGNRVNILELRPDCKDSENGMKKIYFEEFIEKLKASKNLFL